MILSAYIYKILGRTETKMDKLNMQTTNITEDKLKKLKELFPNSVTETIDENDQIVRAIDADVLAQEINTRVVSGREERYQFTWPDKRKSILLANAPINATLRPCREESVDFDTTENLYIEGDNLDVLKLLRETYLNRVKMIYIDPPYNTGNDFVYEDDFSEDRDSYLQRSGQYDEQGNRLVRNLDTIGRFHTNWLNMMYSRLRVARDLLSDDGLIFISIDDNEVYNLKKICNEIFGEDNEINPFIWPLPRGINAGLIARAHEYILVYAKNSSSLSNFSRINTEIEYSEERCNKRIDARHPESAIDFPAGLRYEGKDQELTGDIPGSERITILGKLVFKNEKLAEPVTLSAGWTMKNMILSWLKGETVYDSKGQKIVEFFFKENGKLYSKKEMTTFSIKSVLKDIPDTQIARNEVKELLGNDDIFPYPKTIELSKLFCKLTTAHDDIILDFFSGSASTAHAIMQLNSEDGGKRKFIMVQIPEVTDENSEAYKAGYNNICEIGKERIRRAGQKIVNESPLDRAELDIGFRVLKLDSSNMNDVYYTPEEYAQQGFDLTGYRDNIKPGRTDEDLLFQVMLELGIPLSASIAREGKLLLVNGGYLTACFDMIDTTLITDIAKRKPFYAVFRDSSFINDAALVNVKQIFNTYSPGTIRRVL